MSEDKIILETIKDKLSEVAQEYVTELELKEDVLLINNLIRVTEDICDDGEDKYSAHAHIYSTLLLKDKEETLDACVVGIGENRNESLQNAGENWVEFIAGTILSLLFARPVLNAEHFDEDDDFGVEDCHGFVSPLIGRAIEESYDTNALQDEELFKYVSELAPSGRLHICKLVLRGEDGVWTRFIEIDGHKAAYSDNPDYKVPPPEVGYFTCYAVFHYFDDEKHIEDRRRTDEGIKLFVELVEKFKGDSERAYEVLESAGINQSLAKSIACFTPVAFGRSLMAGIGVAFNDEYVLLSNTNNEHFKLLSHAVYARSTVIAEEVKMENPEAFQMMALTSPEIYVLNDALHSGSQPHDLSLAPVYIPEDDMSDAEIQSAVDRALNKFKEENKAIKASDEKVPELSPAAGKKNEKPWWKIW